MDTKVRIVIADDHPLSRAGLRHVIESKSDFEIVAETGDGEAALESIRALKPDIAVLDVGMPKMDGLAVARAVEAESIPVQIVFLTMYREEELFRMAISAGVKGYVLKDSAATDIVNCINAITADQHYTSPELTSYLVKQTRARDAGLKRDGLAALSPTERVVLRLLADYKTSKQIGEELFITRRTVDNHRANICQKLDIHGSHALMKFALEHKSDLSD